MKITAIDVIETIGCEASSAAATPATGCVVRVSTDTGLTGIGETDSPPSVIKAIIDAPDRSSDQSGLASVLLGSDPSIPGARWDEMYAMTAGYGRRGVVLHAMSAIDIALWDIAGKAAGKAVAELLGGVRRQNIRAYATVYPVGIDLDEARRAIDAVLNDGRYPVRTLKLALGPVWCDPESMSLLAAAVRRHLGWGYDIMLDAFEGFSCAQSVWQTLPALAAAKVTWLEAPLKLDDLGGYAALDGSPIPIAAGDTGLTAPAEWQPYLDQGGVDIVQPDIGWVGGITGLMRIAELARARGSRVIPHGWNSNITLAANLHFHAAWMTDEPAEYSTSQSPLRWSTTNETIAIHTDGTMSLPQRSGLGVTLSDELKRADVKVPSVVRRQI